jgi:hypothetical protein
MEDFDLNSTLRPGTITYEERNPRSFIEFCLVAVGPIDKVIRRQVNRELDHNSDHPPISTVTDVRTKQLNSNPKRD